MGGAIPPTGSSQGCGTTTKNHLLQPEAMGEYGWIHFLRAGKLTHLARNLARMLGHIEIGDLADSGAAGQEGIGDRVERMAQGRGRAHAGDPDWRGRAHSFISAPAWANLKSTSPPLPRDQL